LNKFKKGNGNKSNVQKELVKSKNRKEIQSKIIKKIALIQKQLNSFGEMALKLGIEFTIHSNK